MSGTYTFEVASVTDTAQEGVSFDGNIPEGCYMLYSEDHGNAGLLSALRGMQVGGQVTLTLGGARKGKGYFLFQFPLWLKK